MRVTIRKLKASATALWADTSGVILPYVTVLLVIFVGAGALALDGARSTSLQTQLQKGADALAIAGAAELDRLSTSTSRATSAINTLVTNSNLFTGANVTVSSIRFLSSIPASDNTTISAVLCTNACTTAQSIQARFVEVTVQPVSMPTIMPVQFLGSANSVTAGASAVAGMDQISCGLTPMFICNPFEQPGDTYDQATQRIEQADADPAFKRRLIRLADSNAPGASGTWGPGDFGYLFPEPGSLPTDSCFPGGQEIGRAMAIARPLICVRQNGIDLMPGNPTAALNGLNTRFGKYASGPLSNAACKTAYPPDQNIRTGFIPQGGGPNSWCSDNNADGQVTGAGIDWPPGPNNTALPADSCLLGQNNCSPIYNMGADSWNCEAYWAAAHPLRSGEKPAGCTAVTTTMSRYDMYVQEITNGWHNDAAATTPFETGVPQCPGAPPTANRRLMDVAIVNCGSSPVPIQSNATNVPVAAFGRFFLTHAVPTAGQTKPYAEFRGILQRGAGIVYDQVQLYR